MSKPDRIGRRGGPEGERSEDQRSEDQRSEDQRSEDQRLEDQRWEGKRSEGERLFRDAPFRDAPVEPPESELESRLRELPLRAADKTAHWMYQAGWAAAMAEADRMRPTASGDGGSQGRRRSGWQWPAATVCSMLCATALAVLWLRASATIPSAGLPSAGMPSAPTLAGKAETQGGVAGRASASTREPFEAPEPSEQAGPPRLAARIGLGALSDWEWSRGDLDLPGFNRGAAELKGGNLNQWLDRALAARTLEREPPLPGARQASMAIGAGTDRREFAPLESLWQLSRGIRTNQPPSSASFWRLFPGDA